MTREEYNEQFLIGLADKKQTGNISDEIKILLYQFIREVSNSSRYAFLNEDMKYICVILAYEACMEHIWKFNAEKSDNAYSYISVIIRSSFAGTLGKLKNNEIAIENYV